MSITPSTSPKSLFNSQDNQRRRQWRLIKDGLARYSVAFGGIGVIVAILLIFLYLLYVVLPLFETASMERQGQYPVGDSHAATVYLAMEEQAEIGLRISTLGQFRFFEALTGKTLLDTTIPLPANSTITAFHAADPQHGKVIFGLDDGQALIARHEYQISYPNDVRQITPVVTYPLGTSPLKIDADGLTLNKIAFQDEEELTTIVSQSTNGRLLLTQLSKEQSLLDDEPRIESRQIELPAPESPVAELLLDKEQRNLYVALAEGILIHYDVSDVDDVKQIHRLRLMDSDKTLTSLKFLSGDVSLLVGDSSGRVVQWFAIRDERGNQVLTPIREFELNSAAINDIAPEHGRKGFVAIDASGDLAIFHATSESTVLKNSISHGPLRLAAVAPRNDAMLVENDIGELQFWRIHNDHPEVSWTGLWGKIWYEGYQEPVHAWQSSSASNDFEPKLSLTPLLYGTIKAAFYAMLLSVPLAIMGAIYTAYFMSPGIRKIVKPSIETMEALPTVILGFLAGLWLAPFMEAHLPGMFSLLLITPIGILLFAYAWQHAPAGIRQSIPVGWDAVLLIPVIILLAWISIAMSLPLERLLFDGDIRIWMSNEFGMGFDQRNALVVGFAMGFAVIPTIFSIAEDAIFSVPKHLTYGSLALGATPWQTLTRVIILTASPGIFSAVMIGLGRAVGETMIVLMATGNTPVMDFSVFQGMRTLSANIAVEMPESEVDSTHYRVLFLAAFVLFIFTFFFNTVAEVVRQRLRLKYSSL